MPIVTSRVKTYPERQLHTQGNQSSQCPRVPSWQAVWGQSQSYFCRSPKSTCLPFHPLLVFYDYLHPHHISVHQRQTGDSGCLQCWKTHQVIHSCSIQGCLRPQIDQPCVQETNPRDMVSSGYRAELRPPNTRKYKMHLVPWRPGVRAGIGFIWVKWAYSKRLYQ